ncbi:2-keto-4-pentenoate hydratase [Kribbella sp. NPDC051587]|uniref:2-keto-4-pentenoate hydratase n=1 Tax=Kribbella sp. NPDC051587 TaxID=3364119 RepID=UPI0037875917
MISNTHEDVARRLRLAEDDVTAIAPLTETIPGFTADDAYAVQLELVRAWVAEGRVVVGHKIGLTSRAMREQMGVDEPDYGHLFADMVAAGHTIYSVGSFINPRVEPEIGIILGSTLEGPGVTYQTARAAIESVVASLEVVDSRISDWRIKLEDTVGDNGSAARVVLGRNRFPAESLDLESLSVRMQKNEEEPLVGVGRDVLGSPVEALAWLANTLGARGVHLKAGSLIIPGAMTASVAVSAGDRVTATFDELGTVSVDFIGERR